MTSAPSAAARSAEVFTESIRRLLIVLSSFRVPRTAGLEGAHRKNAASAGSAKIRANFRWVLGSRQHSRARVLPRTLQLGAERFPHGRVGFRMRGLVDDAVTELAVFVTAPAIEPFDVGERAAVIFAARDFRGWLRQLDRR